MQFDHGSLHRDDMNAFPDRSTFPAHVSLAMCYVPYQHFENVYDDEKALDRGTLFADLDLPFVGGKRYGR